MTFYRTVNYTLQLLNEIHLAMLSFGSMYCVNHGKYILMNMIREIYMYIYIYIIKLCNPLLIKAYLQYMYATDCRFTDSDSFNFARA